MITHILGHRVEYKYRDAPDFELHEEDRRRIAVEIRQGFYSGELKALMSPGYWIVG